ncbi:MAG: hypothetical protein WC011_02050 [Candidatus Paceibacterota bacterium]
MRFSNIILNKAIKSSADSNLAWKKEDIFSAIDEVTANGYAILGGDVWAIIKKSSSELVLTDVDPENIAVGIIKGKDGKDDVFNWYSDKKEVESWEEYVNRSKQETIEAIESMKAEESVSKEFQDAIYYNLVFANKTEYNNLHKK